MEQLANTLLWRRRQLVLPAYRAALREALAEGWPMVRPLWHQFGDDPEVAPIADQFLIGDRLMVAPVTRANVTSRAVYLPRGLWRELDSGRLDSGGRWLAAGRHCRLHPALPAVRGRTLSDAGPGAEETGVGTPSAGLTGLNVPGAE